MLLVGMTGNYGMGKSTVLPLFMKLGAITFDADEIVGALLKEEDVLRRVRELLGNSVFHGDGSLNREEVARMIFENDVLRRSLEDIIHPLVFKTLENLLGGIDGKDKIVIVEVPLLFERGYEDRFDRTITVCTDEEVALDRLEKKGLERQEATLRLKTQLPIKEKIQRADFVIDNNGTIEETTAQVKRTYEGLLKEAEHGDNKRA